MDINILLTIFLGLGIPLLTFFITYKKTVGVSKEREKTAYREIVSLIAKLIAHEKINPNFDIINGLIKSKAREYNVNLDISYIPTIFEDVLTKFIENEFISQDVKTNLIDKVQQTQKEIFEAKETKEATFREKEPSFNDNYIILLSTVAALVASIITVIIAVQEKIISEPIEPLTFGLSKQGFLILLLAFITTLTITLIFYNKKEREIKLKEVTSNKYGASIFEDIVFTALKNVFPSEKIKKNLILSNGKEVDFLLTINDERIPIEVKYHTVSLESLNRVMDYMAELNVEKAILITNASINQKIRKLAEEKNIRLIDKVDSEEDVINKIRSFF